MFIVKKSYVNGGLPVFDIDILIYFEKTQNYLNFMIIFFLLHGDFCFVVVCKKQALMFEGWLSVKTVVLWNKNTKQIIGNFNQ